MPTKRGQNEGSIYQRNDGRWVASITIGGKRVSRYGKTKTEAQQKLNALRSQASHGKISVPTDVTLNSWIDRWLALVGPELRPSTVNTYQDVLKPVREAIGDTRLHQLSPLLLTECFARLQGEGRGRRRLHLAHGYLKTCLKAAVDLDLLATNPVEKVRRPKWEPRERVYWSIREVQRFIEAGLEAQSYWDPLMVFLCVTGVRISEAIALQWHDVDFSNLSIKIDKSLVWVGSEYKVLPPKTKAGRRHVSLPRAAIQALEIIRSRPDPYGGGGVFVTKKGNPPRPDHLAEYLRKLCERAGIPRINLHGLRHVAAMLALEAVDDPYLVQKRLGHSHISVTLGIYGYTRKDESEIRSRMDRLLGTDLDP